MAKLVSVLTENNFFQHAEVLKRNREKRHRYGKFFVEGVHALNLAIRYGWEFDTLIFERGRELSDWAKNILETVPADLHLEMAPGLMVKLSDREETSELLALVRTKSRSLEELEVTSNGLYVHFDRPSNPGNFGTSIRSADAFAVDALIVSGHSIDIHEPRVIRSSVGTFFARPVIPVDSPSRVEQWIAAARASGAPLQVVGTSAKADCTLAEFVPDSRPLLVLVGNETTGLSKACRELCETTVSIPLRGSASSLNVSSALSIVLYDLSLKRAMFR